MFIGKDESRWLVRVEEKMDGGRALIHFKGWKSVHDDVVHCSSLRPKPPDKICAMARNALLPSEEEEKAIRCAHTIKCTTTLSTIRTR
jgi:hypothetical protein